VGDIEGGGETGTGQGEWEGREGGAKMTVGRRGSEEGGERSVGDR